MSSPPLLELQNISVTHGDTQTLRDVSMEIYAGEIVALVGPDTAGKSALLKVISGTTPTSNGKILWQSQEIHLSPHERAEIGISFITERNRIFPTMSIEENIGFGGITIREKDLLVKRINTALEFFPTLKGRRNSKAWVLSPDEQAMLVIARGLITEPKLLLLDEPLRGLTENTAQEVFEKIKEINQKLEVALLMTGENIKEITTARTYSLKDGKISGGK